MLLREIRNYMETIKEYGLIQVLKDGDLIAEDTCNTESEFIDFMEFVQDEIIFNKNDRYTFISGREIDIVSENYMIATYISR
ncbi:MAG: hypothetical protein ACRCXT_11185 [Paraclostridium sp.]